MANVEYKADLSGTHFVPPHQNPPPYVTQPQPGIYPAYPAVPPQQVVAVVPVVRQMGPDPSHYTCPSCNTAIVTRVERVSTTKTHLFAALLCLIGVGHAFAFLTARIAAKMLSIIARTAARTSETTAVNALNKIVKMRTVFVHT